MYWTLEILPENYVEVNVNDAKRLGIKTGDAVRVSSKGLPKGAVGKAKVTGLIAEGVIGIYHSWSQRGYDAIDMKIDGEAQAQFRECGSALGTKRCSGRNLKDSSRGRS